MKVIFLQDIKNVAKKNDVKEVNAGYAFNFLLPQKLAEVATSEKIKQVQINKKKNQTHEKKIKTKSYKVAAKINSQLIHIEKKASEKGHLFAAISAEEVVGAIKKEFGLILDPKDLKIKEHIKEIGTHNVELVVAGQNIFLKILVTALTGSKS